MKNALYGISLLFVLLTATAASFAQSPDSASGIKLYNSGEFAKAVESLKKSEQPEELLFLGLAYEKTNENGKAKDAFEKSFDRSYDEFFDKFSEWNKSGAPGAKSDFSAFLQSVKLVGKIGLAAAERAFNLKSKVFQTNEGRIKAKVLQDAIALADSSERIYSASDKSVSALKITERPSLAFPRNPDGVPIARYKQSPNKPIIVKMLVVFGSDGKVKLILPTDKLIDIYTAHSISYFEQIKFTPATVNGKTVTVRSQTSSHFENR